MNEFSVDNFHQQGKDIYRVMRNFDATKEPVPYLSGPYAPALLNDFPADIKEAVQVMPSNNLISFGNTSFNEKKVYITDTGFFKLFSFPLLRGNAASVLKDPNSVVLTEKTAKRYFGSIDNAVGKVIEIDKQLQMKVTGIAKDVPSNSHLSFDLVIPISRYANEPEFKVWINNRLFVYVLLNGHTSVAQLEKRFVPFMDKYMGNDMKTYGFNFSLSLKPLKEVYFETASSFDNVKHGDKTVVYIFISIAMLILVIACINYLNLSTIRAVERSREVGVRKLLGALRSHLVWQFMGESILVTAISCLLSIGLLQLLMPWYNQLLGYSLTVAWNALPVYLFFSAIIIIIGILAGSYPAFFLSAFSPIQALKGKLGLGKGSGSTFRQISVVVQFSISVFLIIGTIIIMNQMNYLKNKQLGYNKEQTIVIPIDNNDIYNQRYVFKSELQNNSLVNNVSLTSGEPGGFFDVQSFKAEGQHDQTMPFRSAFTDFEYVKTLGLKIIAGRDFSAHYATDTTDAVLINRMAAAKLGFTPGQAIGKWIQNTVRDNSRRKIIGVVENFNFLSLKENMDALVISPGDDNRVALINLKPGDLKSSIASIKASYTRVAPMYPLEYSFLDQKFDELYQNDLRQQTMLSVFAGLAIFIACLGLFGLASFTAAKRVKEIGVRKVLGSSVQNIVILLSKDLLKPVLIATCIAIPAGYYAMNKWLQNFAYKTSLHWWIFLIAAVITVVIALLTVSIKAVQAAVANPISSLRTE